MIIGGATFLYYELDYTYENTTTAFIEFGKIRKTKKYFSRWGLGPSYNNFTIFQPGPNWGSNYEIKEEKKSLGVHMTLQKIFAGKYAGFGASIFADLNLANPYAGILLTLSLGQIK